MSETKLSVVIPVYNEKSTILEILRRVRGVGMRKEIIVVDDCSTDGTREILQGLPAQEGLKILYQPRNMGVERCERSALQKEVA